MNHMGIEVRISDNLCKKPITEFFRKPRTMKKRIIKKWKKRSCNWKVTRFEHTFYHDKIHNIIFMSKEGFEKFKDEVK